MPSSIWCRASACSSFAKDKATARIASEFYVNAINVMRGASGVSHYVGPPRAGSLQHRILAARRGEAPAHAEAEEPCRPHRASSPAGPAASARRSRIGCLRDGACVVLADIDEAALDATRRELRADASARTGAWRADRRHQRRCGHRRHERGGPALWRPRYRRQQCRHFFGSAGRGHDARLVEPAICRSSAPAISSWRAKATG